VAEILSYLATALGSILQLGNLQDGEWQRTLAWIETFTGISQPQQQCNNATMPHMLVLSSVASACEHEIARLFNYNFPRGLAACKESLDLFDAVASIVPHASSTSLRLFAMCRLQQYAVDEGAEMTLSVLQALHQLANNKVTTSSETLVYFALGLALGRDVWLLPRISRYTEYSVYAKPLTRTPLCIREAVSRGMVSARVNFDDTEYLTSLLAKSKHFRVIESCELKSYLLTGQH
jgi:hypothetical protein